MKNETFFKKKAFQALFLDRDGVLNQRRVGAYVAEPDDFIFLDGVLESLAFLASQIEYIFVVTNQQGIGKGIMSTTQLDAVHQKMLSQIGAAGGRIDGVYYCPHLETLHCDCRKPKTGLALQAKSDFPALDFSRAVMVGDFLSDIQLGTNLGMYTVFIDTAEDMGEDKRNQALQLANETAKSLHMWIQQYPPNH